MEKNSNTASQTYSLKELYRLGNGNTDFVVKMIRTFIKGSTELYTQLRDSLKINDWIKIGSAAHKAIPSFSFMGLNDYAEKLRYIQYNASDANKRSQVKEFIDFIETHLDTVLRDLTSELVKLEHKTE
ncbi:MAG: Hpt domain-containing protein [Bacteroidia bacterium]